MAVKNIYIGTVSHKSCGTSTIVKSTAGNGIKGKVYDIAQTGTVAYLVKETVVTITSVFAKTQVFNGMPLAIEVPGKIFRLPNHIVNINIIGENDVFILEFIVNTVKVEQLCPVGDTIRIGCSAGTAGKALAGIGHGIFTGRSGKGFGNSLVAAVFYREHRFLFCKKLIEGNGGNIALIIGRKSYRQICQFHLFPGLGHFYGEVIRGHIGVGQFTIHSYRKALGGKIVNPGVGSNVKTIGFINIVVVLTIDFDLPIEHRIAVVEAAGVGGIAFGQFGNEVFHFRSGFYGAAAVFGFFTAGCIDYAAAGAVAQSGVKAMVKSAVKFCGAPGAGLIVRKTDNTADIRSHTGRSRCELDGGCNAVAIGYGGVATSYGTENTANGRGCIGGCKVTGVVAVGNKDLIPAGVTDNTANKAGAGNITGVVAVANNAIGGTGNTAGTKTNIYHSSSVGAVEDHKVILAKTNHSTGIGHGVFQITADDIEIFNLPGAAGCAEKALICSGSINVQVGNVMTVAIEGALKKGRSGTNGSPFLTFPGTIGFFHTAKIQVGSKRNGFSGESIFCDILCRTVYDGRQTGQLFCIVDFKACFVRTVPAGIYGAIPGSGFGSENTGTESKYADQYADQNDKFFVHDPFPSFPDKNSMSDVETPVHSKDFVHR